MRILQLIHKIQNRGAETFACQLSSHLIKLGHEVKIVALYDGDAKLPIDLEIIVLKKTNHHRLIDFMGWRKLSKIISEFQPDLIQANAGDTLKYAVFSKVIFKWKQPLIFRNASEVGRYLRSPIQKHLNTYFYKNVDWVISVSHVSKKDIISHFPFLQEKTEVIGVGLESNKEVDKIILKPLKSKHIVHVGGFTFEKNHKGLLAIFEEVLKEDENIQLHLIGAGPLKNEIKNLVKVKNLLNKVTFYGFVSDPLPYIKAGDILVLPSIIEGLPAVILEAMFCKTPVIAFDVGGISEILGPETGYLVAQDDNILFCNAILKALHTPNDKKIETANNYVVSKYTNSKLALNFVNSYEKLATILD